MSNISDCARQRLPGTFFRKDYFMALDDADANSIPVFADSHCSSLMAHYTSC